MFFLYIKIFVFKQNKNIKTTKFQRKADEKFIDIFSPNGVAPRS